MLSAPLQRKLAKLRANHLLRKISTHNDKQILIPFCSNDYLSITKHPDVIKAYKQSADKHGLGSGSSAQIAGYSDAHHLLEETFADFLRRDKAILFNSGYHANLGVITALADRSSLILADKQCHASIIDGILLSRATLKRFHHNQPQHAAYLLQNAAPAHHSTRDIFFITESVFSAHGDIANIKQLAITAKTNHATLIVDDAHGIGVLGKNGAGIIEEQNLSQQDVPCLITPLGKAIGSTGAIVSGSADLIDALLQLARTHRYSTALPPAVCMATCAAIRIISQETWRRAKLKHLISYFMLAATERNLPLTAKDLTPIKSIAMRSNKMAADLYDTLYQCGFHVACIRPPSVPAEAPCLRISLNCDHEEEQVTCLLDYIKEAIDDYPH